MLLGYEITGHPRGLEGEMSFMNVLSEIDHPMASISLSLLLGLRSRRILVPTAKPFKENVLTRLIR